MWPPISYQLYPLSCLAPFLDIWQNGNYSETPTDSLNTFTQCEHFKFLDSPIWQKLEFCDIVILCDTKQTDRDRDIPIMAVTVLTIATLRWLLWSMGSSTTIWNDWNDWSNSAKKYYVDYGVTVSWPDGYLLSFLQINPVFEDIINSIRHATYLHT